ncbi:glycosyltransferase family 4 protein [Mesorhizobium sp. 10J20-29]
MARILFISEHFWPATGGIEVRAKAFLPAMVQRGHEYSVLTTREPGDGLAEIDELDGIKLVRIPFPAALRTGDFREIVRLRRRYSELLAEFQPDLIHIFYGGTLAMLLLEKANADLPVLASFTTWPMQKENVLESTLGRLLQRADWVTANSSRLLDMLGQLAPRDDQERSVVYSGNPLPGFEPDPLPASPAAILCLGRVIERKGFDLMIRAMPEVLARFPETRLRIVGDGDAMDSLRGLVAQLRLEDRVSFDGMMSHSGVSKAINQSSFVVIPSRGAEPFATVAIETMQMGRPCIASRCGGMEEAVVDGETGLMIPEEDVGALATAAIALLEDPERAARMGQAGYHRARTMHGWDRYLDEFGGIYERLYNRRFSRAASY